LTVARLKKRLGTKPSDLGALLEKLATKLDRAGKARARRRVRAGSCSGSRPRMGQQIRMIPRYGCAVFLRRMKKYNARSDEGYEALIRKPIKELVDELDPEMFWQIHRATIVKRQGDRRCLARLPRQAVGAGQRPHQQAGSQSQLHASLQTDVAGWICFDKRRAFCAKLAGSLESARLPALLVFFGPARRFERLREADECLGALALWRPSERVSRGCAESHY